MLTSFTRSVIGAQVYVTFDKYRFRLTRNNSDVLFTLRFTSWDVAYLLVGIGVAGAEVWTKHWALTNLVALSFAFNAISLLKLDGFKTGAILLGGLFLCAPPLPCTRARLTRLTRQVRHLGPSGHYLAIP